MFAKGQTVAQIMEAFAPKRFAVPDDRIGLQLGTLNKEIQTIVVTLDVTELVVNEAIELGADLIIAHHAIIFRPLKHLQTDFPAGKLYEKLIKHDIAVYISHTNLDVAEGGVNDLMAQAIGIEAAADLETTYEETLYKLITYIPESSYDQVSERIFAAGAGKIGNYHSCSFNVQGTGTFFPEPGTNPYIGHPGQLEQVKEIRFETIVAERQVPSAVQALRKSHPYEEPAYDLFKLELKGKSYGLGRVGKLQQPATLQELAERVKVALQVPHLRIVGSPDRMIAKAAVLGGSGARYIHAAERAGADVLITGDIDFHTAQDALAAGLSIIDPGHHTEKILIPAVTQYLTEQLQAKYSTKVYASTVNTEPFSFM